MTRDEMIGKLQRVSVRLAFIPAADLRADVMAVIAALSTPAPVAAPPVDVLDGPRVTTALDREYAKALDVINQQREELDRLRAAPPADLVATCEWSEDANGEQSAACLAGAEALRRIEAYDKAWDAYETSPHGGTFTAMMNARAEMFALLATETTR